MDRKMIKLDKNDVELIKDLIKNTDLYHREIAELFGVSRGHITKIKNNKRWNYEYGQSTCEANRRALERRISFSR
jgi:predicted XRE-type DNA-binding protein